jgi:hypothetical protein
MPWAAGRRVVSLVWGFTLASGLSTAAPQGASGEIYGRVADATGAVLPGVAVTIASPVLPKPLSTVTTETGAYSVPLIPIGTYTARFELAGFRAFVQEGIRIEIGLHVRVNATLAIGSWEEAVDVTGGPPPVDLKDAGKHTRFTLDALQAVPSARDPWAIIEQSAGVAMDRQNVGGSTSGQQGNFVVRGTARESKWTLDGADITDMAATGSSPLYYDFDAFEEIQVTTGGADVTVQSSGLAINLVTKSGTDRLRGSGRFYASDDALQANNLTDDLRRQGAYAGNPIQNIRDYGLEAGGPLLKGHAWLWGSYGTQRIAVGINNFYKPDAACQAMKADLEKDPLSRPIDEIQACLVTDRTTLATSNLKFAWRAARNNQVSFLFSAAEKTRPTREASDLRPIETSLRQSSVTRADLGSRWWTIGIPKTYRWTDRHVFGDRLVIEGQYTHVGNNFVVTFQEASLRDVQPGYEYWTGAWSRSYAEDINVRPTDDVEVTARYLLPGAIGGDHALTFGVTYRNDRAYRETTFGGNAVAVFMSGKPTYAQIYRPAWGELGLHNRSFYVQDSYSRRRATINAGFRFDHQHDYASPTAVPASPFHGQPTYAGLYLGTRFTGQPFNQLPGISFAGQDPDAAFDTVSPRAGVSIDLTGNGKTVLKFSFARYAGQLGGSASIAAVYNPVVFNNVTYPWIDLNGDGVIQAAEIVLTPVPVSWPAGYDYKNPSKATTSATADPSLSAERASEIIVSVERLLPGELAVSASYIWRRYSGARWNDRTDWTSADYQPVSYSPSGCPSGARCDAVFYYDPRGPVPVEYVLANQPDYWRGYHGFELTARRRLSKGWMLSASFSSNDARAHYDSWRAFEDPTNIGQLNDAQYAPSYLTSSGLPEVYLNAKWIFRASATYRVPLGGIDLAAFYDSRSGYPFAANIKTPMRSWGAGYAYVYLDRMGDNRLDTLRTLDLRVGRGFTLGRLKVVPAMDVFNALNASTILSRRPTQNASNANQVSAILSPRVVRLGLRAEW